MSKRLTAVDRRHFAYVASLPCCACKRWEVQVHHVVSDGFKRLSKDHKRVVPLCRDCHTDGPNAVHRISHAKFCELYGIDLLAEAERLWNETP